MIHGAGRLFPVSSPPVTDGALRIVDGTITAVGTCAELRRAYPDDRHHLRPDCIIMPGLVNVHTHLEYSAFRHLARPTPFRPWLKRLVEESLLRRRFWPRGYWEESARRGARLALSSGTTTVGDFVTFGTSPAAALATGIRMRAFIEVVALRDGTWAAGRAKAERQLLSTQFSSSSISPGLAPHSIYTLSRSCLEGVAALAEEASLPLAIHAAESIAEKELLTGTGPLSDLLTRWDLPFADGPGGTIGSYLQDCGILGPRTLLVHGVHLDGEDLSLARRSGASLATCCRSNHMLQCGSPPLSAWEDACLPYAYGTDSLASAPDLDLLAEARFAADLDRTGPVERLRRLTLGGAEALFLDDVTGSLETGKEGDFIFVTTDDARRADEGDVLGSDASAVALTYVQGRRVYPRPA